MTVLMVASLVMVPRGDVGKVKAVTGSEDLANFPREVTVIDPATGVEVEKDSEGKYKVKPGVTYTFAIKFQEKDSQEMYSADNNGMVYYKLPDGVTFDIASTSGVKVAVTSTEHGEYYLTNCSYEVVDDGSDRLLKFYWNYTNDHDPVLTSSQVEDDMAISHVTFFMVNLEGQFKNDATEVKFSDDVTIKVDVDDSKTVSVDKTVGHYDANTGMMEYNIKVTSTGNNDNIAVKDLLSGDWGSIDISTINAYTTYWSCKHRWRKRF